MSVLVEGVEAWMREEVTRLRADAATRAHGGVRVILVVSDDEDFRLVSTASAAHLEVLLQTALAEPLEGGTNEGEDR